MDTKNDIKDAAGGIWAEALTQLTRDQVDKIVDRGDGSLLLSEVLRIAKTACESEDEAVSATMSKLEKLAEETKATACVLMMHLSPIAGDHRMHHIYDAIDLWIWDCDSPKLTEQLRLMAQSEKDPSIRRHYESLANRSSANSPGQGKAK